MRIDKVQAKNIEFVKSFGNGVSIVAGLLKTGAEGSQTGYFFEPFSELFDAECIVIESLGAWLIWADDMAKKVFLSDVDPEKKAP